MNIISTLKKLPCGHKPTPHSYWQGNANQNDKTGKITCFKCMEAEKELSRRQVILDCGHTESPHSFITSGYGTNGDKRSCYECCAIYDLEAMRDTGKNYLYFSQNGPEKGLDSNGYALPVNGSNVSNWPGNLRFSASWKYGHHNMARVRYDYWFNVGGECWHGYTIGDNTQIAHCKKIKGTGPGPSYKCLIDALTKAAARRTSKDTRKAAAV